MLLGELQELAGDPAGAARSFDLVRSVTQLQEAAGADVDLELALFEADHGSPSRAVDLARAAHADRPTIYAADALAWALRQAGDPGAAVPLVEQSLRLGTSDPLLHFHAAATFADAGDRGPGPGRAADRARDQPLVLVPAPERCAGAGRSTGGDRPVSLASMLMAGMLVVHPLGNFTSNTYAGIVVSADEVVIDYVLDLAEIPTQQLDGSIGASYADDRCEELAAGVRLEVDGEPVETTSEASTLTFPPGLAGLATLRLECRFVGSDRPAGGRGRDHVCRFQPRRRHRLA